MSGNVSKSQRSVLSEGVHDLEVDKWENVGKSQREGYMTYRQINGEMSAKVKGRGT